MLKCIRITLAVFSAAAATLAQANEGLRSDYLSAEDIGAKYSEAAFRKINMLVCMRFDRYKSDISAIKKKYNSPCQGDSAFACKGEGESLSMRGIVRADIYRVLKIDDPDEFERSIPGVISNALTFDCGKPSVHYGSGIPFLKQRRNFAKRAIFIGKTQSFFDEFLFEEYSTVENGKRKTEIDINAVEYVDGEPETLLDYLDKILIPGYAERLGGSNRGDVESLRYEVIRYGAKRASELGIH